MDVGAEKGMRYGLSMWIGRARPPSIPVWLRAKAEDMPDRLALGVIPGTRWSARDILMVAREAEDAGFVAALTATHQWVTWAEVGL
jgi:hypothetical protein